MDPKNLASAPSVALSGSRDTLSTAVAGAALLSPPALLSCNQVTSETQMQQR